MLNTIYHQIWRPTRDSNYSYCVNPHYAKGFPELCSGYASAENRLRRLLDKSRLCDLEKQDNRIFPVMKQVQFELQEHYRLILLANKKSCPRIVSGNDFRILEKPMRLSEYHCIIAVEEKNLSLQPFHTQLAELPWYLEHLKIFSSAGNYSSQLTRHNLLLATAALRCLLHAQFGPESDAAITPTVKAKETKGYYPAQSLFQIIPPLWSEAESYEAESATTCRTFCPYPFELPVD